MDENFSNTNVELIIHKATANQLVEDAQSFSHQCSKAVKDMAKAHLEKLMKKKGIKENYETSDDGDDDDENSDAELAKYINVVRNHSLRGWFLAPYDPNQLINVFPCLHIKEGYHLGSYQGMDRHGNGYARVLALPENKRLSKWPPQKALNASFSSERNTKRKKKVIESVIGIFFPSFRSFPKWSDRDIENYIEGDGSPLSYFQASIYFRELYELGSIWHNVYWGHHKLVTSPSDLLYEDFPLQETEPIVWTWKEPEPKEWCPIVWKDEDKRWNVKFYTIDRMNADLVLHKDKFIQGYDFKTYSKSIANYPGGYMV